MLRVGVSNFLVFNMVVLYLLCVIDVVLFSFCLIVLNLLMVVMKWVFVFWVIYFFVVLMKVMIDIFNLIVSFVFVVVSLYL